MKKKQLIASPIAHSARFKNETSFSVNIYEINLTDLVLARFWLFVWDNICRNKYYEYALSHWSWVADRVEIPLACAAQMIGKTKFMYSFPVSADFMLMYHKEFYDYFYPAPEISGTI